MWKSAGKGINNYNTSDSIFKIRRNDQAILRILLKKNWNNTIYSVYDVGLILRTELAIFDQSEYNNLVLTSRGKSYTVGNLVAPHVPSGRFLSENKLTSIANATRRELREGHNLEKLYMSGEFNG